MSKNADQESDSPVSRHSLDESKDNVNLVEPTSGQGSFELQNDFVDTELDNTIFIRQQNREGGIDIHETTHKTLPPLSSSFRPLSDNITHEVSESSLQRTADLVHQPSHWRAEPLRAVGSKRV